MASITIQIALTTKIIPIKSRVDPGNKEDSNGGKN